MKPDYNLEFSHIYANESFSKEQLTSIEIAKKIAGLWERKNISFVTTVLIDDYNATVSTLNHEKLLTRIEKEGINVDFLGFESRFSQLSNKLIKELPTTKMNLEYFSHPQKEVLILHGDKKIGLTESFDFSVRHTCAILSATWTMCRLGEYPLPKNSVINRNKKEFRSKKTMTVLPKKYEEGEKKVLDIIKMAGFRKAASNIEYKFF